MSSTSKILKAFKRILCVINFLPWFYPLKTPLRCYRNQRDFSGILQYNHGYHSDQFRILLRLVRWSLWCVFADLSNFRRKIKSPMIVFFADEKPFQRAKGEQISRWAENFAIDDFPSAHMMLGRCWVTHPESSRPPSDLVGRVFVIDDFIARQELPRKYGTRDFLTKGEGEYVASITDGMRGNKKNTIDH